MRGDGNHDNCHHDDEHYIESTVKCKRTNIFNSTSFILITLSLN
jgi:hypothetical protein